MYDFGGEHETGVSHDVPHQLLTALEVPRLIGEYSTSRLWDLLPARNVGGGRSVLVLPGFGANDMMTGRLRGHLRHRGFRVHGWGQGRNHGLTDRIVDGLPVRLGDLHDRYDQPVSLVGWSFGGVLARWLGQEFSEQVRQVVCLASPWRAEGERTRATRMFEKSREEHGISPRAREIVDLARKPLPVPCTAVWSRTDGIVPWQGCRVDRSDGPAPAENVEVLSSHVGMVANPIVLAVVVDRLVHGVRSGNLSGTPR